MIEEIIENSLVKNMIKNLFKDEKTEIIIRPASYVIRLKNEKEEKIKRIIILQPKGFTANKINELPPHPEARKAKITIKGGIKHNKIGFNPIKNVIKFCYYTKREIGVEGNYPNTFIDKESPFYREEIKSSKQKFFVVKENGKGFYHSLINLSDEWILLILEKELRFQKEMNINSKIKNLDESKKIILTELIEKIKNNGDKIFEENMELINKVINLNANELLPVLIEALNIYETGRHQPCTIYAIILKFGKINKEIVKPYLQDALKKRTAPSYYLNELLEKIK